MIEAIVLGLVQGITEFLPVSSSGHLQGVPYLLGLKQPTLAFSVALHAGTLVAVVAYFWSDLMFLAAGLVGRGSAADVQRARATVGLLAVASVPAAVLGLLLSDVVDEKLGNPRIVAGFLVVTGLVLLLAEKIRRDRALAAVGGDPAALPDQRVDHGRDETTVTLVDALAMGGAQALAIMPGISRAGATIATGMMRGMSRQGAARFSFLMSVPVIFGASVLEVGSLGDGTSGFTTLETIVGMLVATASGYAAIRFLLRLISTEDLTGFAYYVFVAAGVLFVGSLWLGPA